jgi:SNF2 family DNA or RNA helicase
MKFSSFRNHYFYMERVGWDGEAQVATIEGDIYPYVSKGYKIKMIPARRDEFYSRLGKYVHFAKKNECLDLPDEIDEVRSVDFDPKQKQFYDEMQKNLVIELSEDSEVTATIALTKIMKLNQISNGFVFDDNGDVVRCGKKKLKELAETLEELGNQQVIIWGHFVEEIKSILEMLGTKSRGLYGETKDGDKVIDDFVAGKFQYLVAHPASGSEGFTLVNASVQVFASLNYSLLEYEQCRGRTHRPGQKNKCVYIHLLTSGSIEEEIYLILKGKKTAQELAYEFIERKKHSR